MAKSSRKTKQMRLHVKEDRLSSLPEPLIHHIFSNLDLRQVIQTSILSNTWRYTWLSTPTLHFNFQDWKPNLGLSDEEREKGFCQFVNKVLNNGGTSPLHEFFLIFYQCNKRISTVDVHGWVSSALARNVQHLFLFLGDLDKFLELPQQLFTSCITQLRVHCFRNSLLGLPSSVSNAAKVRDMNLVNVRFPDGNGNGELILNCPVLQHLNLNNCGIRHLKLVSLSAPLLESLCLYNLYTAENSSCMVKMSIPTLETLSVSACLYVDRSNVHYCVEENLSSLVSAYVTVDAFTKDMKKECAECLIEVLNMVSNVQELEVSGSSIQAFTHFPHLLQKLPETFPSVRYVLLMDGCEIWSMNTFLSFLEKFPQAERFVWNRHQIGWTVPKREKDWETKLPSQSIFKCLKTFEMWSSRCTETEQKFMEILLERAVVLEEVIIKKGERMGKKLIAFREKLCSLPRASSNVVIRIATDGS